MEQERKGIYYGIWMVAGCFVLLFLCAGTGFYSFSIFIAPLEESFGWSRSAISLTMSIYMLVSGMSGPWVGHLTETYQPKKVMMIFAFISGAGFILVSFTTHLWFFYCAYALLSFGNSGIGLVPVSSLLSRWFIKRRGTAIGSAMLGISIGGFIMAPLVGQINTYYGWRISFVCIGLLMWAIALPIILFVIKGHPKELGLLPDGTPPTSAQSDREKAFTTSAYSVVENEGWPLAKALGTKAFWGIAISFFLAFLAQMGILQHQVPMTVERGISTSVAATALGITAGLGGLGKLSFGRIVEILPFRYAAGICFGLQALAVYALLIADSLPKVWVFVIVFGFATGGTLVLIPLATSQFFGLTSFGIIMGVFYFVQALGMACGTAISGLIYDTSGSYHIAMITYIGLYIAAIISIYIAGTPRPYCSV